MILDTSFIIDIMNKDPAAMAKFGELDKMMVAAPTLFELYSGVARSGKPRKEKEKIFEVLGGQTILALEKDAALEAGNIDGALVRRGKRIGPVDSMIAGIALTRNEPVLTRNTKDFRRIRGLKVETY